MRATLVARLAGPLQSWGTADRHKVVRTHPSPTLSALLGICRSALGHGRDADPDDVAWLRGLTIAVRIDHPGEPLIDYHMVNPRYGLSGAEYKQVTGYSGVSSQVVPFETWRHYMADAAFLALFEGEKETVERLASALLDPAWQRSGGRKGCTFAAPFLLGIFDGDCLRAAAEVPALAAGAPLSASVGAEDGERPARLATERNCPFVVLNGDVPVGFASSSEIDVEDDPQGSSPVDGYRPNRHRRGSVRAPACDSLSSLLDFAKEQLHV